MIIRTYHRDEAGIITFMGEQEWDVLQDALEYYCRDSYVPETEQVVGWADSKLTWYGDFGVAQ